MTKEIFLRQLKGNTLVSKGESNHWVVLDTKPEVGGHSAGTTPKELMLMALAGCTSMDVIPILKKKRSPVAGFECRVKGTEREEHPKYFTDIHIEYVFYGDGIKPEDVERAIELSETKYCSVSGQLRGTANITTSYRIEPASALNEAQG
ncbi:MAG: OsmC family protein [Bacteroidetes bacterium]|jgi:putative redox protein|nr:OsmC family protein [Bacteroidota bacterium]